MAHPMGKVAIEKINLENIKIHLFPLLTFWGRQYSNVVKCSWEESMNFEILQGAYFIVSTPTPTYKQNTSIYQGHF